MIVAFIWPIGALLTHSVHAPRFADAMPRLSACPELMTERDWENEASINRLTFVWLVTYLIATRVRPVCNATTIKSPIRRMYSPRGRCASAGS